MCQSVFCRIQADVMAHGDLHTFVGYVRVHLLDFAIETKKPRAHCNVAVCVALAYNHSTRSISDVFCEKVVAMVAMPRR